MSRQNVEIVRECIEAFQRGDYATAMEALDPEIEYELTHFPDGKIYTATMASERRSGSGSEPGRIIGRSSTNSSMPETMRSSRSCASSAGVSAAASS
jgi:hypothetical protein